ncbi:hypothetical protein PspLS_11395 [Pyricularia sp. CBS 133598]|nr:hypothetical protein PspLS_11395 [Pyricularia sp. CBS 133598]
MPVNELLFQTFLGSLTIFVLGIDNEEFSFTATTHYGTDRQDIVSMSWQTSVDNQRDVAHKLLGTQVLLVFPRLLTNHQSATGSRSIEKVPIEPSAPTGQLWDVAITLGRLTLDNEAQPILKQLPKGGRLSMQGSNRGTSNRVEKRYSQGGGHKVRSTGRA